MAYGLEVYSDDGFIQIADSVSNYFMLYSGSIIVPQVAAIGTSPAVPTYVTISHPTPFDAIAVYTPDRYVIPRSIFTTPTTSTSVGFQQSLTQGTLRYWLFKRYTSIAPSSSGYGMEIYNADGTVSFSTQYPKIMRSYSTIPVTNLTGTQSFSLPTDRMFAFLGYGTVYNTGVAPTKAAPDVKLPMAIQTYSGGVYVKSSGSRAGRINSATPVYTGGLVALDVTNY